MATVLTVAIILLHVAGFFAVREVLFRFLASPSYWLVPILHVAIAWSLATILFGFLESGFLAVAIIVLLVPLMQHQQAFHHEVKDMKEYWADDIEKNRNRWELWTKQSRQMGLMLWLSIFLIPATLIGVGYGIYRGEWHPSFPNQAEVTPAEPSPAHEENRTEPLLE